MALSGRLFLSQALNFLLPTPCVVCGRMLRTERRVGVCHGCWGQLENYSNFCACCGKPFASEQTAGASLSYLCGECRTGDKSYFSYARSAGLYRGAMRELIQAFKYNDQPHLGNYLAAWMLENIPQDMALDDIDAIVPVPLHISRLRQREYNQAQILADAVGRSLGKPVVTGGLYRKTFEQPQVGLPHHKRRENIRGAFGIRQPHSLAKRKLLLVDDVYTTGATARECAKMLLSASAAEVRVLTLAHTPDVHL